jgi:hypothetical protein
VHSRLALFLALPALACSQAALTSWTRSSDPGSGMVARDISPVKKDGMRDAVAALHAIAKTDKISSDPANQSITVQGSAREAGLAEWLAGQLDNPDTGPYGHGYIMPSDSDDVILAIGGLHLDAARMATSADLQEMVNAIRVLADISRTAVYPPTGIVIWRGRVWQNDLALWLLRELGSPPTANWSTPVAHRIDQASPSVRIFYFAPQTSPQELGQIGSTIRQKAPVQRVVALKAARAILVRGTEIEATAAERIVAAARH